MALMSAPFDRQFDSLAGIVLVVAGLVALRRPRSWTVGASLLVVGVTWLADVVEVGPFSTLFVHRAVLALALVGAVSPRWHWQANVVPLLVFAVVCAVPQWATEPWLNGSTWLAVVVGILLLAWISPRRTRVLPALVAFSAMGVVAVIGVAADWPDSDGRRLAYHFAAATTATLVVVAVRSPIDPNVAIGVRPGSAWTVGVRGPHDPGYVTIDGGRLDVGDGHSAIEFDVGELGKAVLVHDDPAFDDPRVRSGLGHAVRVVAEQVALRRRIESQARAVEVSCQRVLAADREASAGMSGDVEREVEPHLDSIEGLIDSARARDDGRAVSLLAVVRADLRSLVSGATPPMLDSGLGSALELLAASSAIRARVRVEDIPIDALAARALFMVASEAVANATKHSDAAELTITLEREGRDVVLRIADDGVGGAQALAGGGIAESRRRASSLGGSLDVESRQGGGTCITVRVPVDA